MTVDDLACQELVELVTDYLEDALASAMRVRFTKHLDGCPFCEIYVEQVRETIRLTGYAELERPSPERSQQLLDAFRAWRSGR